MAKAVDSETICVAPFAALKVGAEGHVSPCCEYVGAVGFLKDHSLRDIWKNDALKELRASLAAGDRPKACWKCWQVEASKGVSLRQSLNARFAHRLPKSQAAAANLPADPTYLDIRLSNLCNFRCRTCHHGASSRWFADAKAVGQTAGKTALLKSFNGAEDAQTQLQDIGKNISDIYFAGGEPLLEKQHFELLRHLISENRKNIRLSYNTNLSVLDFEGSDLVKLWQAFPRLHIEVSIDAIGDAGAYIRRGFDWQVFQSNLARLTQECSHANLNIGVTVSVFNLLRLTELHATLIKQNKIDPEAFEFHAVQTPRYYDIAILPKDLKERAMVQIEAYAAGLLAQNAESKVASQLLHIVQRLTPITSDKASHDFEIERQQFRTLTAQLDELRAEDVMQSFPELASLISP